MKVLIVTDSDSYIKWGASIADRMPRSWSRTLVVLRTPALPSARQLESSFASTGFTAEGSPLVDLDDLSALITRERPEVVLLSVRGPVVRVLVRVIAAACIPRPFIVSGLPGISIPATLLALYYRSQVDLIILHSKREIAEFRQLGAAWNIRQDFALATLPFLSNLPTARGGSDIVFAAQAKVPRALEEREQLLGWLVETARRHPDRRVILKLRGLTGEAQTHAEQHPFDILLDALPHRPANLIVSTGPMAAQLERAAALVTVSSTAAIEAVAMGIPVLALDDFGVTAKLINLVFEGSGVLGSSDQLIAGEFHSPDLAWVDENYFHSAPDEDWIAAIEAGVARRLAGPMPLRAQFRKPRGGIVRTIWDRKRALGQYDRTPEGYVALGIGLTVRNAVRVARRMRRRMRAAPDAEVEPRISELV